MRLKFRGKRESKLEAPEISPENKNLGGMSPEQLVGEKLRLRAEILEANRIISAIVRPKRKVYPL